MTDPIMTELRVPPQTECAEASARHGPSRIDCITVGPGYKAGIGSPDSTYAVAALPTHDEATRQHPLVAALEYDVEDLQRRLDAAVRERDAHAAEAARLRKSEVYWMGEYRRAAGRIE